MRLWSIHPCYLDAKGLVALWREALLAKNVLEGKTKGYKNHPQLERFKKSKHPIEVIHLYLQAVHKEATAREYNFNKNKIDWNLKAPKIKVTRGQINYETKHLLKKLKIRDKEKFNEFKKLSVLKCHPVFLMREGEIESWEKIL